MKISLLLLIGYLNGYSTIEYQDLAWIRNRIEDPTIQTMQGIEIEAKYIGASVTSTLWLRPNDPLLYTPYHSIYTTDIWARIKDFRIGWEHVCYHPVLSQRLERNTFLYGGYNLIYLKGKVTLYDK